jgi:hypothetical protein
MSKWIINVTTTAAGMGLKEMYNSEGQRRGRSVRPFVAEVLSYALKHKNKYNGPLERPRDKGGTHISIEVTEAVKEEMVRWALEKRTTQAQLVNYILEKSIELKVLDEV